jgi:hypothetical protein
MIKKMVSVEKDVICGQAANCILMLQVRYTTVFFVQGIGKGLTGMKLGLFAPDHSPIKGYRCYAFHFKFFGLKKLVAQWPWWYTLIYESIKIDFSIAPIADFITRRLRRCVR